MTVVCAHTGNVSVAKMEDKGHCNDNDVKNCMKIEVKSLSPTDMAHNDFYHIQPIQLSLLPQFISNFAFACFDKGPREDIVVALA